MFDEERRLRSNPLLRRFLSVAIDIGWLEKATHRSKQDTVLRKSVQNYSATTTDWEVPRIGMQEALTGKNE